MSAVVQHKSAAGVSSLAFSSNVTAGNLIVVAVAEVQGIDTSYTPSSVSDGTNTYSIAVQNYTNVAVRPVLLGLFYTIAKASGPLTVTSHVGSVHLHIYEISGYQFADAGGALVGDSVNLSNTLRRVATSTAPYATNELVLVFFDGTTSGGGNATWTGQAGNEGTETTNQASGSISTFTEAFETASQQAGVISAPASISGSAFTYVDNAIIATFAAIPKPATPTGFNTIYTNSLQGPNADPFDPVNWSGGGVQENLQVSNSQGIDDGFFADVTYSGRPSLPTNQWMSLQTHNASYVSSFQLSQWILSVRSVPPNGGYTALIKIGSSGFGNAGSVSLLSAGGLVQSAQPVINVDDVFLLSVVGPQVNLYQNGAAILTVTDTTAFEGGTAILETFHAQFSSDTGTINLQAGVFGSVFPTPTAYSLYGQYLGPNTTNLLDLLAAVFRTKGRQDLLQIVDSFGNVVYNVNNFGQTGTTPTPTAVIGRFEARSGNNAQTYFASAFTNPSNLDIIQIVEPGGGVVFWVDYQGNVFTTAR